MVVIALWDANEHMQTLVKDAKERTHYWTDVQAVAILLRYPMTF